MGESELIEVNANLREFFQEAVESAAESRDCAVSDTALLYLATLLADYGRPDALNPEVLRRPVTFLLRDALQASGPERFERLRCLGDDVLYVSGFFGDHLARRGVELDFVRNLGSRAYDEAAAILRGAHAESASPDVFGELASRFGDFVLVLGEVADLLTARAVKGPREVLDLYERWMKTGSVQLAESLARWGVIARRTDGVVH